MDLVGASGLGVGGRGGFLLCLRGILRRRFWTSPLAFTTLPPIAIVVTPTTAIVVEVVVVVVVIVVASLAFPICVVVEVVRVVGGILLPARISTVPRGNISIPISIISFTTTSLIVSGGFL